MRGFAPYRAFRKRSFAIGALILAILWALLYLPNLRTSPTWYGDETGTLMIGRDLVAGQSAIQSLLLTHMHTYYPIQPVYAWIAGLFSTATSGDIVGARFFNTLLALGIALIIFGLGRKSLGAFPAWWAAGLFLTYFQSIIHFRWVYPHNAVALGFTVMALFLLRPSSPGNDRKAGLGLALAALAHPLAIHGAVAGFLCRLKRPQAWLRLAIPPAVALGLVLLLIYWKTAPRTWLFDDLRQLASYYSGRSQETSGGFQLFTNLWVFFTQDTFHLVGIICVVLCFLRRKNYILGLFTLTISVLLLQNRANLTVFYYQAIVLVPLLSMAWGMQLSLGAHFLKKLRPGKRFDLVLYLIAFSIPILLAFAQLPTVLEGRLTPRNQPWTTQNTREVDLVAQWLNQNTSPTDLVIANTNIAWLLHARTADLMQATLWDGFPTEYLAEGMPRERFRYSADMSAAKYVVIGDIDQRWMLGQLNVARLAERLMAEKWPIVQQGPNYLVLQNPHPTR